MQIIGVDQGAPGGDHTCLMAMRNGFASVIDLPRDLGDITKISMMGERMRIDTASGVTILWRPQG